MRRAVLLLVLLMPSVAGSQWWRNGKRIPDETWRRSQDDLGVMLLLTTETDAFVREWYSTPESHVPNIRTTDRAVRGDVVSAFVLFSGCKPSPSGTCDGTVDFTVLKPDGSLYGEAKNYPLCTRKASVKTVQMSPEHLDIQIEPRDPLGLYTVKARVRDKLAGITLEVERRLEVVVSVEPNGKPVG